MSKLEDLKAQVKELNKQIRDLEAKTTIVGKAKFEVLTTRKTSWDGPVTSYRIGVYESDNPKDYGTKDKMTVIIKSDNFDTSLEKLDRVITDLIGLRNELLERDGD